MVALVVTLGGDDEHNVYSLYNAYDNAYDVFFVQKQEHLENLPLQIIIGSFSYFVFY